MQEIGSSRDVAMRNTTTLVARAQFAASSGDVAGALRLFGSVLEADPTNASALSYLAAAALARGDSAQAVTMMRRSSALRPDDMTLCYNLAVTLEKAGQLDEAKAELQRILCVDAHAFEAELVLGRVCDAMGDHAEAVFRYFGAVKRARAAGAWLNDASVPAWLHKHVIQAMRVAQTGYHEFLSDALDRVRERFGPDSIKRIDEAVRVHLNEVPRNYADPRQRPTFFYIPGLPAVPVYSNDRFPWMSVLENAFPVIREEVAGLLQADGIDEPFNRYATPEQAAASLAGSRGEPAWKAKFFFRHGAPYPETHERCPATSAALAQVDLCRITDHAPEVCFSLLTPGTHILPHRGVTNARLVCHLALVIPEDCALSVVGRELHWEEGKCFVFDDTFEHEAWNRSDRNRAVLLMDVWNPDLSPAERSALDAVIMAIGVFNRACGIV